MDLRRTVGRKLLALALPALALGVLAAMMLVEAWVRWRWDATRGTPGFFVADAQLGQRLVPGYDGWFAGVPVRINRLGFRGSREYDVEKRPATFRILVLGDSVTFGHGAISETTYPYLLERRLQQWRDEIDWQVWNLGVPGYNTSQELAYLERVGPRYQPHLVIVGFFENDLQDEGPLGPPGAVDRARAAMQRAIQSRLYSYELYKRVYLTARLHLFADENYRRRLTHLSTEEQLLTSGGEVASMPEQQVTEVERLEASAVQSFECLGLPAANPQDLVDFCSAPPIRNPRSPAGSLRCADYSSCTRRACTASGSS